MYIHWSAIGAGVIGALTATSLSGAEPSHAICPLTLYEEQLEREEILLALDLATSRLAAEESIFRLVDQLWQKEAVQRIVHLAAKHDRDVAEIELKRLKSVLEQQDAVIEQYTIVCSGDGQGIEAVRRRHAEADCQRVAHALAIAQVDLAYFGEVLSSVRDLRKGDVATQQDVIRAELDLESARKQVGHYEKRVQACAKPAAR